MAFATQDHGDDVMNEINMTPLVDVMLVLLIIFIITVPAIKHAVRIDLPRASSQREQSKAEPVRLSVDAQGGYYWNGQTITDSALPGLLAEAASRQPQPDLQLHGDKAVRYERVAAAMAAAHQAGLRKIAFVTAARR